jgi:uncharacterized protein YjiS (DUF1127 family)
MSNILSHPLAVLAQHFSEWRQRQQAYAELAALDDRSLADIGITRSEIPYVLAQGSKSATPTEPAVAANDSSAQHAA